VIAVSSTKALKCKVMPCNTGKSVHMSAYFIRVAQARLGHLELSSDGPGLQFTLRNRAATFPSRLVGDRLRCTRSAIEIVKSRWFVKATGGYSGAPKAYGRVLEVSRPIKRNADRMQAYSNPRG
jgi:hypothetical protein